MSTVVCYAQKHFLLCENLLSNIVLSNMLSKHLYLLVILLESFYFKLPLSESIGFTFPKYRLWLP